MSSYQIGDFIRKCGGDAVLGVVLSRVAFRAAGSKVERDGERWAAHDLSFWARDTGLTERQLRRSFEKLRAMGLIVSQKFSLFGKVVVHYRVPAEGQLQLPAGGQSYIEPEPLPEPSVFLTEDQTPQPPTTEDLGKETAMTEKKVTKPNPFKGEKAQSILDQFSKVEPISPEHVKITTDYGLLWRQLYKAKTGEAIMNLTHKQVGQLKMIGKGLGPERIAQIVDKWKVFAAKVAEDAGLKAVPDKPNIDFLLKHLNAAHAFLKTKAQTKPKVETDYEKMFDYPVQVIAPKG